MSKIWNWVEVSSGGVRLAEKCRVYFKWCKADASDLPDWVKAKMAMLDLMEPLTHLSCDSYRYLLVHQKNGVRYKIMEDEDDRNN